MQARLTRFIVAGVLCLLGTVGCRQAATTQPGQAKGPAKSPTPEEAQAALIELVEGDLEGALTQKGSVDVARSTAKRLKLQEILDRLKNGPVWQVMRDWGCILNERKFSIEVEQSRVHSMKLSGRFELDANGVWKAVPLGYTWADFPDKGKGR
jgi:hypothetical protein